MKTIIVTILALLSCCEAFIILDMMVEPSNTTHEGSTVVLKCTASGWYEYCIWRHEDKVCEFEWKSAHKTVKQQTCTALQNRAKFVGNYETHECDIELSQVKVSDSGMWSCEMEAYVWGPARGSSQKASMLLTVLPRSTTLAAEVTTDGESGVASKEGGGTATPKIPSVTVSQVSTTFAVTQPAVPEQEDPSGRVETPSQAGDETPTTNVSDLDDEGPEADSDWNVVVNNTDWMEWVESNSSQPSGNSADLVDPEDGHILMIAIACGIGSILLFFVPVVYYLSRRHRKIYPVYKQWPSRRGKEANGSSEDPANDVSKRNKALLELAAITTDTDDPPVPDDPECNAPQPGSETDRGSKLVYSGSRSYDFNN